MHQGEGRDPHATIGGALFGTGVGAMLVIATQTGLGEWYWGFIFFVALIVTLGGVVLMWLALALAQGWSLSNLWQRVLLQTKAQGKQRARKLGWRKLGRAIAEVVVIAAIAGFVTLAIGRLVVDRLFQQREPTIAPTTSQAAPETVEAVPREEPYAERPVVTEPRPLETRIYTFTPLSGSRFTGFQLVVKRGRCLIVSLRDRIGVGAHLCEHPDGAVSDPCYPGTPQLTNYVCYYWPWDSPRRFVAIERTGPDKSPPPRIQRRLTETEGTYWGLGLENGLRCIFSFDRRREPDPLRPRMMLEGPRGASYLCASTGMRANVRDADGWIIGDIDESDPLWRVQYEPVGGSALLMAVFEAWRGPEE